MDTVLDEYDKFEAAADKFRNNVPEDKRVITPLLVEFYNALEFELRLVHIPTGHVVGYDGFIEYGNWEDNANIPCLHVSPLGATAKEVYELFVSYPAMKQWLPAFPVADFKLSQTLGDRKY